MVLVLPDEVQGFFLSHIDGHLGTFLVLHSLQASVKVLRGKRPPE